MKDRAQEAITSFKETQSNIDLTVIFFILAFLVIAIIVFLIVKNLFGDNSVKKKFFKIAASKGLTEEEAEFLYKLASKQKDPILILKLKPVFEKLIHSYVETHENVDSEFIKRIREKLGFAKKSKFLPLITTKDIEPLQKGIITILKNMLSVEGILHDKDEKYMYWHLSDIDRIHKEFLNSDVEVMFIRPDDAIYKFESSIESIYMDNGKVIVKLPHNLKIQRIQRRRHARVSVSLTGKLGILKQYDNDLEKLHWIDVDILNISAGGAYICLRNEHIKDLKDQKVKELSLKFKLENVTITTKIQIVREKKQEEYTCFGVKFVDLSSRYEEIIHDYVRKKQIELRKLTE